MMSLLLFLYGVYAVSRPVVIWQQVIDNGGADRFHGLDLHEGKVYAGGESCLPASSGYDMCFFVFDSEGDEKLRTYYREDGGLDEWGNDVAVLPSGNVVVAGSFETSILPGWFAVWFSQAGDFLYGDSTIAEYDYSYCATCIVAASCDTCYVAGWVNEVVKYPRVCKLTPQGKKVWRVFGGTGDVSSIALDSKGSVFVLCRTPCLWRGWEGDASPIFSKTYTTDDAQGAAIRINSADHVFITGDVKGLNRDFMLMKYNTIGDMIWSNHRAYNLGASEYCRDMALDSISDCYLAGWQAWGSDEDAALVKTDSAGTMLWSWVDTVPGLQEIEAIEVDKDGYIYLAGSHHNGTDWDALVMKIRQPLTVTGNVTDSTGKAMWKIPVAVSGDTTLEVNTDNNGNYEITIYNGGNYTIRPNLPGYGFEPAQRTYTPLAHREWNQDFDNGHWTAVSEQEVTGAPTLEVKGSLVCFSIPGNREGTLSIYSSSGRLVKRMTVNGEASVDLSPFLCSGIYFVMLEVEKTHITRKWVLLK